MFIFSLSIIGLFFKLLNLFELPYKICFATRHKERDILGESHNTNRIIPTVCAVKDDNPCVSTGDSPDAHYEDSVPKLRIWLVCALSPF